MRKASMGLTSGSELLNLVALCKLKQVFFYFRVLVIEWYRYFIESTLLK